MAIDRQFVSSLVQDVQAAGPANSSNPAYAQLLADQQAVRAKISANQGRQVSSVNAGESVSWQTDSRLQDLYGEYTQAIAILNGRVPLVTRTTARILF
jgi:hypothetical protein